VLSRRRGSHILLVNRFIDGGEVVSLTRRPVGRPPLSSQKDPWYSFMLRMSRPPGQSAAGRIRSNEIPATSSEIELATFRLKHSRYELSRPAN
jgi:hypothetical protein